LDLPPTVYLRYDSENLENPVKKVTQSLESAFKIQDLKFGVGLPLNSTNENNQ